jgi:hypothetical protein
MTADNFHHIRIEVAIRRKAVRHALAVRRSCYAAERHLSALPITDGNDHLATHIVAYAHDEPIASARIRWFRDFAKVERSCVERAHRNFRLLRHFSAFIEDHVARKGYDRLLTDAEPTYATMWRRLLGFVQVESKESMTYKGCAEPFVELVKSLAPHPNRLSLEDSTAVLCRIEGRWDAPSRFERMAATPDPSRKTAF